MKKNKILIITKSKHLQSFRDLLGDGTRFGISIDFEIQKHSSGIPEALLIGEKFIKNDSVALILGDNFFYGPGMGRSLNVNQKSAANLFGYFCDPTGLLL